MAEDNFFTDIESTLKEMLSDPDAISINGSPVPVRIVTPDPDFIELELPCITLQLTDIRRDTPRTDNGFHIENDMEAKEAHVRTQSKPYNFHYTIGAHSDRIREDRLLVGQVMYFIDENPAMTSLIFEKEMFLHRDVSFRELSRGRGFAKSIDIIIKARLDARHEEIVPFVQQHITTAGQI